MATFFLDKGAFPKTGTYLAAFQTRLVFVSACIVLCMLNINLCKGQARLSIADLDLDGRPDTLIHEPSTNVFTIRYADGKKIARPVHFFEGFEEGIANMSFGTSKGALWFSIRFAPKYLDQDTLWFGYNKKMADWRLLKMTTYRFNTMDPKLISHTCSFRVREMIRLLSDRYERLQTLIADRRNRTAEKCIEKQEE